MEINKKKAHFKVINIFFLFFIIIIMAIVMVIATMLFLMPTDKSSQKNIFSLVISNEELLRKAVSEIQHSNSNVRLISKTQIQGKRDNNPNETAIEKVINLKGVMEIRIEDNIIEFPSIASGFGSETTYYGFYYAQNDKTVSTMCCGFGTELTKEGNGWIWRELGGDNSYYTEKIIDNFYYYKQHY